MPGARAHTTEGAASAHRPAGGVLVNVEKARVGTDICLVDVKPREEPEGRPGGPGKDKRDRRH